ncbi:putative disease resistance protein [Sesamum angolense]|uniref:Disease resistance protein n=1 Tax=Sesamum angolense TaxID=2727404 RepID=A0AAE1WZQ5_9LAMI|nr:putative disease resistance protein [Sesamum angolense]
MFPSLNSLRSLKSFRISHCTEIECISTLYTTSYLMEEKQESCCFPFQSLENLILSWLPNLTSLIQWDVRAAPPTGTFSLKKLRIEFCNKIRKLFTLRTLQNLYSLEEVYVSECAGMEEIIGEDDGCELESNNSSCCSASVSSSYNDQAILTLPKLRALSLKWLPELRSICRETVVCDSIETIGMFQCHKIKRLPFFMPQLNGQPSPPPNLKQIRIGVSKFYYVLDETEELSSSQKENLYGIPPKVKGVSFSTELQAQPAEIRTRRQRQNLKSSVKTFTSSTLASLKFIGLDGV